MGKNRKPLSSIERFQSFVDGFWDGSSVRLGAELSRVEKSAHFFVLVVRSFIRNRCPSRASALSYTTLLALIPMLAVVLSFTSSLLKGESEEKIDQFIDQLVVSFVPPGTRQTSWETNEMEEFFPEEPAPESATSPGTASNITDTNSVAEVATEGTNAPTATQLAIAEFAKKPEILEARKEAARSIRQFIQNTRSGTLGVTGSIALVFIAISMLARIEDTFNDIWGVERGRTWFMRVVLYWSVITLAPLLLVSTLMLASGPHFVATRAFLTQMPFIGNLVFQFLPVLVLWLAFAAFYMLVPNTKVQWTAALAGGFFCALLWHVNNSISALYVSRVVTNSKIYGSLGMVPVFMIGLYFSWLFLLLGAQVAYAWQNRAAYLQEKVAERVDQRGREFVALRLMTCVGQCFQSGEPASISDLSATLGLPSRLTQQVLQTLKAAQLVWEVAGPEPGYLPARPLETITCHDILLAMRSTNGQPLPQRDEPATNEVLGEFERIQAAERQAAGSVTMAALVDRAQARLQLGAPVASGTTLPAPVQVLSAMPVKPERVKVVPAAEPEPPPSSVAEAAPADPGAIGAAPPAPLTKPGQSDFVSIKIPPTKQPTKDEERSFPL